MSSNTTDLLPEEAAETDLVGFCKAAGDKLRLEVLQVLAKDSYGVLELCRILDSKQSGLSHHLKVLANAGLVTTRREGNSIFYRRALPANNGALANLQAQLFQAIDQQALTGELRHRRELVSVERVQASQRFFAENAHKFREQQDLIASYPVYAEQVEELLLNTILKDYRVALEVGPGEGEFLSILAPKFEQVIALDNASSMLDKARALATEKGLSNIEFIHGDTRVLSEQAITADCIVLNMVLHHTPSPATIFQDLSATLISGGALIVTDLCHHDQNWAREACGDLWLGFDPEDFDNWAKEAQLELGQSAYFALRNGFQIQIRQFFKPNISIEHGTHVDQALGETPHV